MKVRILMITYNRPAYTEMALQRLCETLPAHAAVTVWDNGSGDEMRALLKRFEKYPGIERIIYHPTNDKLRGPTNWFWENTRDADYVSKVDDDGLMPDRWVETLEQMHREVPETGVLGTWRFPEEDFVPDLAARKIQRFGSHQLLRNCWVEGSGYLMKRGVIERIGLIREQESFTTYCTRAAAAGFINGWYYPFLYQEHMDDPRAPHSGIKTEEDFRRLQPLSARTFNNGSIEEWTRQLKYLAWSLQVCSWDPKDYLGWRPRFLQRISRLIGRKYLPRT